MHMQTSSSQAIAALELFDSKIEKIHKRSFIGKYEESKNLVSITATKGGSNWNVQTMHRRADDESVDAVVLTLRFFIQDNEPCSLRNLDRIYNEIDCLLDLSEHFKTRRSYINDTLSCPAQPKRRDIELITNRDVLETFVFGEMSHSNVKHRNRYAAWQADPMSSAIYTQLFHRLAYEIFMACTEISAINSIALSRLRV